MRQHIQDASHAPPSHTPHAPPFSLAISISHKAGPLAEAEEPRRQSARPSHIAQGRERCKCASPRGQPRFRVGTGAGERRDIQALRNAPATQIRTLTHSRPRHGSPRTPARPRRRSERKLGTVHNATPSSPTFGPRLVPARNWLPPLQSTSLISPSLSFRRRHWIPPKDGRRQPAPHLSTYLQRRTRADQALSSRLAFQNGPQKHLCTARLPCSICQLQLVDETGGVAQSRPVGVRQQGRSLPARARHFTNTSKSTSNKVDAR